MSQDPSAITIGEEQSNNDLRDLLGATPPHNEQQQPKPTAASSSSSSSSPQQQKRSSSPSQAKNNNNNGGQQSLSEPLMADSNNQYQNQEPYGTTASSSAGAAAAAAQGGSSYANTATPSWSSRLILAIVNPLSGERSAADGLVTSLLSVLGEDRVLKLSPVVFRDSTPIQQRMADGIKRVQKYHPPSEFDGSAPDKRMSVLVAGGDGTVSFVLGVLQNLVSDPNSGLGGITPALMIIPMGTGNDLSNAMGYGLGFQTNKCCCCCFCCPNDIEAIVKTGLTAPVTPFDRWNVTLYRVDNKNAADIARVAKTGGTNVATNLQNILSKKHRDESLAHNTAASGMYSTKEEWARSVQAQSTPQNDDDEPTSPSQPNFVALASFDFNNYCSFGLDAAIANDFDDKRKKYPACHSYRTLNKIWYGYHGLAMSLAAIPFDNDRVSVCCDKNEVALSSSQDGCRAFVISNIPSYSGGVDLWGVPKVQQDKQTFSDKGATRDVTYHPNSVSDGMIEVVSIGGFFHLGFLRMGMSADRIAQGGHVTFSLGDFAQTNQLKGKTLTFQVDGEPAGQFTYEPGCLVVDVKLHSRAYFHKVDPNAKCQCSKK